MFLFFSRCTQYTSINKFDSLFFFFFFSFVPHFFYTNSIRKQYIHIVVDNKKKKMGFMRLELKSGIEKSVPIFVILASCVFITHKDGVKILSLGEEGGRI